MEYGTNILHRLETIYKDLVVKEPISFSESGQAATLRTLNFAACSVGSILSIPTWKIPKSLEAITSVMKTSVGKERVLTWLPANDSISLQVSFGKTSHLLTMTSIQASILFLFDELKKDQLTIEEIMEHTGLIDKDTCMVVLHSLMMTKIPLLIQEGTFYQFVSKLNTRHYHVRIPQPLVIIKKEKIHETIDINRDYAIDGAIVRIMKSRKQLGFTDLQTEVVKQLSRIFIPMVQQIKKRLENLIDREYIERDVEDVSLLKYIA